MFGLEPPLEPLLAAVIRPELSTVMLLLVYDEAVTPVAVNLVLSIVAAAILAPVTARLIINNVLLH